MTQLEYRPGLAFKYHRVVDLFPRMEEEEFRDLVDDIAINGVRTAVWMYRGEVIDGRHRTGGWLQANEEEADKPEALSLVCPECEAVVRTERRLAGTSIVCPHCPRDPVCSRPACGKKAKAGELPGGKCGHWPGTIEIPETLARRRVPPLPVCEWDGEGSLVAFVFSLNLHRRHLETGARAMLVLKAAEWMEEEARQRQLEALKQGKAAPRGQICHHGKTKGKTRDQLAKLAGVSGRTVQAARKVKAKGTKELQAAVESGKVSVSKAAALANKSPEEQLAAMAKEAKRTRKKLFELDLKDALGKGGAHLEAAKRSLQKAAKAIEGYNATKTERVIAKAQERLDEDVKRLLGGRGAA